MIIKQNGITYGKIDPLLYMRRINTVANAFGISRSALKHAVKRGRIPAVTIDKVLHIDISGGAFQRFASRDRFGKSVVCRKNGSIIKKFKTIKEAGEAFGIDPANISKVLSKKCPNKTACGYHWEYF